MTASLLGLSGLRSRARSAPDAEAMAAFAVYLETQGYTVQQTADEGYVVITTAEDPEGAPGEEDAEARDV